MNLFPWRRSCHGHTGQTPSVDWALTSDESNSCTPTMCCWTHGCRNVPWRVDTLATRALITNVTNMKYGDGKQTGQERPAQNRDLAGCRPFWQGSVFIPLTHSRRPERREREARDRAGATRLCLPMYECMSAGLLQIWWMAPDIKPNANGRLPKKSLLFDFWVYEPSRILVGPPQKWVLGGVWGRSQTGTRLPCICLRMTMAPSHLPSHNPRISVWSVLYPISHINYNAFSLGVQCAFNSFIPNVILGVRI